MKKYSVVEFGDGLALVATMWLDRNNNTCIYPTHLPQNRINKAVEEQLLPSGEETWQEYPVIRIFGTSESYERGIRKLRLAETTSNIEDTDDTTNIEANNRAKKRRREMAKRKYSSDDHTETDETESLEHLPSFPDPPSLRRDLHMKKLQEKPSSSCSTPRSTPTLIHRNSPISQSFLNETPQMRATLKKSTSTASPSTMTTSEIASENEFRRLVLSKLNNIIQKIGQIEERLTSIEQWKIHATEDGSVSEEEDTELPLQNLTDLNHFEQKLKDLLFFKKMINMLKRCGGGSDVNSITTRILRQILSNSLAQQFSWAGFKGKSSFKDLRMAKLLIKTVRTMKNDVTDDLIVEAGSKWLAQAKVRACREEMRIKRKSNNELDCSNDS
uniref:DUF4806 domain-containing protein n=1 Tax=Photinus pyralis TaxID=7054 RepID=A0A1Y1KAW5_PHOPY